MYPIYIYTSPYTHIYIPYTHIYLYTPIYTYICVPPPLADAEVFRKSAPVLYTRLYIYIYIYIYIYLYKVSVLNPSHD